MGVGERWRHEDVVSIQKRMGCGLGEWWSGRSWWKTEVEAEPLSNSFPCLGSAAGGECRAES